jgi:hypothetical protein
MLQLRTSLGLLAFASILALPALAGATEPTEKTAPATAPAEKVAEKTPVDDSGTHLTSLELMLRPTLGGAGGGSLVHAGSGVNGGLPSRIFDGSASPYGASYGIGAEVGFRFHPVIAAGLRGDFAKVSASAPNDGTTGLSRSRQSAGLYLRAYPLALTESVRKHVDPWFGTGVLYMHDTQDFHVPYTSGGTTLDTTVNLEHHAVGIPLALGVDYRVTRAISIGPSFEYTLLAPIAGCGTVSAPGLDGSPTCSGGKGASSKAIIADSTGAWTAGLDIRFTPF